jgi:hypothetical protein
MSAHAVVASWHRCVWPALLALVLIAIPLGCSDGSPTPSQPGAICTASPSAELAIATLEPVESPVLGDRVTLYGADPGDGAMGLAVGDFNGDTIPDAALAAPQADGPDNTREDAGEVLVFLGPFLRGQSRDAALGEEDVTVLGADRGDQLGLALASADVDGDGIDDLIMGAPFGDGPNGERTDAGEAYILLGTPTWPAVVDLARSQADLVTFGRDSGDLAGFSLAAADVDGNRYGDLLVGAFQGDGPENTRPDSGEAYMIPGSPKWPATVDLAEESPATTVYGAEAKDRLAQALGAGDFNGDGVDDLIVPAPFASGPDNQRDRAGEVYVILGGRLSSSYDAAEEQQDVTIFGLDDGDQIGHSVAAGDFNGDGIGDLILGAVSADGCANDLNIAGEAYIVLGGSPPPSSVDTMLGEESMRICGSDAVDRLGRSAAAGDLNGDGLGDVLIAATGGDPGDGSRDDAGEVYVILGRATLRGTLDLARQSADLVIEGLDARDVLGHNGFARPSLLAADMDGDGFDDVIVSARGDGPSNDRPDAGEAYILFAGR